MAQNISISEGGTAQQFGQINKLKIANSGGGTSLWVPEDEVQTKSLHVDSNGTYYASQDECYGYDEVSVNITDECFGYDDDGNLWDVEVDEDDFLEEEEMPVRIEVTTPPTKTSYIAYEPINTAGMVVMGYYADGSEYGEIPREEYTIDPIVATVPTGEKQATSDIQAIQQYVPFAVANAVVYESYGGDVRVTASERGAKVACVHRQSNNAYFRMIFATDEPQELEGITWDWYTYSGKTVYYNRWGVLNEYVVKSPTPIFGLPYNITNRDGELAWTMIYGTITNPKLEVKVKWERDDGEVLEDSFEVNVSDIPVPPISGDDSGGGGSSGGSW